MEAMRIEATERVMAMSIEGGRRHPAWFQWVGHGENVGGVEQTSALLRRTKV